MNAELQYFPIHWKNGMVFSASQLESQYFAVLDRIKDATALQINQYNYGLLGGDHQLNHTKSFVDNITNEKVKLSYGRAVTMDGSRIEILNQNWDELFATITELQEGLNLDTANFWYVLVGIDPFLRVPEGKEDPNESPRRKPFTRPAYQLAFVSLKELQNDTLANAFPIAKFERTASGLRKVDSYIPPCMRINSHEKLVRKFEEYENYLNEIKGFAEQIIAKVKHKNKNEKNYLADDIGALCQKFIEHFVHNYDEFKLTYKEKSPIVLITFFSKLARVLDYTMDIGNNKDHLLQYFREYTTDLNVAQLNRVFSDTYQVNYVHYDCSMALSVVDIFLNTLYQILNSLVKLDYNLLAKRDVVKMDVHNTPLRQPTQRTPARNPGRIIIKRSGQESHLGDDLVD